MRDVIRSQSGNALWFILFTVALLGFLTAILSRSGSSVDQAGNIEQQRISASAVIRYGKSIETAVRQLISGGMSENTLDFAGLGATYDNPDCSQSTCEIFNTEGGGIVVVPPANVIGISGFAEEWLISTGNRIGQQGCDDADDSCRDLVLLLKNIPDQMCIEINNVLGVTNPSGAPPTQEFIEEGDPFTGDFGVNSNNRLIGGTDATRESPQLRGKEAGCLRQNGGGQNTNFYFQVLLAR